MTKKTKTEKPDAAAPNRAARRAALREAYAAGEAYAAERGESAQSEAAPPKTETRKTPAKKSDVKKSEFKKPDAPAASREYSQPEDSAPVIKTKKKKPENAPKIAEEIATEIAPENPQSAIPVPQSNDSQSEIQNLQFDALGLSAPLVQAIADLGFEAPTPIQAQAIPALLKGEDLIGQAQTGTGKTAAFALPILQNIHIENARVQALVLAPTRELAVQVAGGIHDLAKHTGIRVVPVYGGQPIDRQFRALKMGAHIVVGTPGRIIDHLRRGSLSLETVSFCVLDEADEMLALGFLEEVEEILAALPEKRQTALFSATMPPKIKTLAKKFLRSPEHISIDSKKRTVESVEQTYYEVPRGKKPESLARVLDMETPGPTIVFCRTRQETNELSEALRLRGYSAEALNGEMSQNDRDRVLRRFKNGQADLLVATDVAARGLDIETVTHVINYDIPWDVEQYIHRIGRTGRAGRSGDAITLVEQNERRKLKFIEQMTGVKMKLERIPTSADIAARRRETFVYALRETLDAGEFDGELETVSQLSEEYSQSDIAAAALHMLWQSRHIEDSSAADFAADHEQPETGMTRIFIGLGKQDGLRPGELVATIAGQCDIPGKSIGAIDILDRSSFVEVPEEKSEMVIQVLRRAKLRGKKSERRCRHAQAEEVGIEMEELWQNLKRSWAKQNVKVCHPASTAEIEHFEADYQIRLPSDFKSYLLAVNGMDDETWETDDDWICFWSLRNTKSLKDEYPNWAKEVENADEYFIFADYCIRCHDFALRLSSDKPDSAFVYVLYSQPQKVASSFTEFIERYIAGDSTVTFP